MKGKKLHVVIAGGREFMVGKISPKDIVCVCNKCDLFEFCTKSNTMGTLCTKLITHYEFFKRKQKTGGCS